MICVSEKSAFWRKKSLDCLPSCGYRFLKILYDYGFEHWSFEMAILDLVNSMSVHSNCWQCYYVVSVIRGCTDLLLSGCSLAKLSLTFKTHNSSLRICWPQSKHPALWFPMQQQLWILSLLGLQLRLPWPRGWLKVSLPAFEGCLPNL